MHRVLDRLRTSTEGTVWDGRLFVVGGAVRDQLLTGAKPVDFDLMVQGDALALAEHLFESGVSSTPPVVFPRFGTAMVRVDGQQVELAAARADNYEVNSRKPMVREGTLAEDAARRDFTVNALMRNLHTGEVLDPTGLGIQDLAARRLRTPRDPGKTFSEDPLRMLRAVRFCWQLGFSYDPALREAIVLEAPRLSIISAERIQEELRKMLALAEGHRCLEDLQSLGLTAQFAPELDAMVGVEQGKYHHLDVWHHSLLVVSKVAPGDHLLRLSALLHDVGKPATRFVDDNGDTRFFGHEDVGARMAREILGRLKYSNAEIDAVALLVRNHMRLGTMSQFSMAAARRVVRDLGEHIDRLLDLVEADASSLKPGVRTLDLTAIREKIQAVRAQATVVPLRPPLNGREIIGLLGISSGATIGRAKEFLMELVLEGELAGDDRQGATERLRDWFSRQSS